MKQARKIDSGASRRRRAKRQGRKVRKGGSQPGRPGAGSWREAWEPTSLLLSIDVAMRARTPGKALDGRPGHGREARVRKARRAGDRASALKGMKSSRKDELDSKGRGTVSRKTPPSRLETVEQGGGERPRRFPACLHIRLRGAANPMNDGPDPRQLDRATFDRT